MFRRNNKSNKYQPSKAKLVAAISILLDNQKVNLDSKNVPLHLRLLLLEENPKWKVPERRVARYLKKQLKARKNPKADDIDADVDEDTVYTNISKQTSTASSNDSNAVVIPTSIVCISEDGSTKQATSTATTTTTIQEDTEEEVVNDNTPEDDHTNHAASTATATTKVQEDTKKEIVNDNTPEDDHTNHAASTTTATTKVQEDTKEEVVNNNEEVDGPSQTHDIDKYYAEDNDEQQERSLEKDCFDLLSFVILWYRNARNAVIINTAV